MPHVDLGEGLLALYDEEDERLVGAFRWYPLRNPQRSQRLCYAAASSQPVDGRNRIITMHRLILRAQAGQQVDHVDGNGLNNVRRNLRFCTGAQNRANAQRSSTNTSGYKGVSWHPTARKWVASIQVDGRRQYLGLYPTREEAARAYNAATLAANGEFARPNPLPPVTGLAEVFTMAGLSPREMEIGLALAGEGLSYDEVAQRLGLRRGTIGVFVSRIREKIRKAEEAMLTPPVPPETELRELLEQEEKGRRDVWLRG